MLLQITAEKGDCPVWGNARTVKRMFEGLNEARIRQMADSGAVLTTKLDGTRQSARLYLLFGAQSVDAWLRAMASKGE